MFEGCVYAGTIGIDDAGTIAGIARDSRPCDRFIIPPLIDAHVHVGNKQALEVARKFADWAKNGTDKLNDEQFQKTLICEHGGMNEALANLS